MKLLITLIIILIANTIMAQDTIKVFVNNKAIDFFTGNEKTKTIELEKTGAEASVNIFLQLQVDKINKSAYKQSIEITNQEETQSSAINVLEKNYGKKNITSILKKYSFFKGEAVKVFLLLNPANEMMMMPSRRIFLGELISK